MENQLTLDEIFEVFCEEYKKHNPTDAKVTKKTLMIKFYNTLLGDVDTTFPVEFLSTQRK